MLKYKIILFIIIANAKRNCTVRLTFAPNIILWAWMVGF